MITNQKMLVDVPTDEGVHVKTAGAKGEKYVYKYVKYFRNADGKPRNKAKSIGKYDLETGKMRPNQNYFEMYNIDPVAPDVMVWDYGYSYLVLQACKESGLMDCLSHGFGKKAMDIIVMAAYMIREGGAMDGIDDWLGRNYFPNYSRLLTSQSTSKLFSSLTPEQEHKFFVSWVEKTMTDTGVCYDVTSVSSYAQEMTTVEHGYNRDHEKLAQFNLGMFCDELNKLPIYYNRYNGSLTDKTNLSHVLANAKDVGIKRVKMILDGGFWDEVCFRSLDTLCDAFTVGMPTHFKESKVLLDEYVGDISKYANELNEPHTYCVPIETDIHGIKGKVLLYFDSWSHVHQCQELSERINRYKAELQKLKRYPKSKLRRYEPYFVITKHEEGSGFDFEVDFDKVEKARKNKGYFMIFSTDDIATPDEILGHYRAKDVAEKMFAQIKCEMEGNRIRTHNEKTTDGKTFVTFVACIIRTYMLNKLKQYLRDNSTSLKKVFNQLSNITIISTSDYPRFTKAFSKKQREILQAFDADKNIITSL